MKRLSKDQVPGVYRRNVGDIAVATVNDGRIPTSFNDIVGVDPAVGEAEHRAAMRPVPPFLSLNCFLVETSDKLMLIDAGFGDVIPGVGKLIGSLAALGVEPNDIDVVLMTHLHADHDAGLIDKNGAAVFPNAELVAHEDELAFWRDERSFDILSAGQKKDFAIAQQVLVAYADRIRPVKTGDVAPGISAVLAPGHTPGHTAWRVSSGADQLLIWGDVVHLVGVQFALPEASILYDADPVAAAVSRRRLFDMVAADRIPVAGVHLDFPGYGLVTAKSNGGFAYAPEIWSSEV